MAFLAVAYPNINDSDYRWVQNLRQKHDRQFDIVEPHITLVFDTNKLSSSEFTKHVQNSLAKFKSFPISLDSAKVVEDNSKNFFHTFLIPSNGFGEINELT
jgi:2'-5' RNA ligase